MSESPNVVSIVGQRIDDVSSADAIECLEVWLERVRSGEITSVAIAGVGPGRATGKINRTSRRIPGMKLYRVDAGKGEHWFDKSGLKKVA